MVASGGQLENIDLLFSDFDSFVIHDRCASVISSGSYDCVDRHGDCSRFSVGNVFLLSANATSVAKGTLRHYRVRSIFHNSTEIALPPGIEDWVVPYNILVVGLVAEDDC